MFPVIYSQRPFDFMTADLDRIFDEFLLGRPTSHFTGRSSYPALTLWKDEDAYYLEAECPGYAIEDLEISVLGNQVCVSGEKKAENPPEGGKVIRRERPRGHFCRILDIPEEVEPKGVEAVLKNGLLTVKLPKAESAKPRKIEIQSN